ncbi:MAG: SUMF1/EgtB/PvdO family nonheme iron enzyme [Bacteroidota bacterium]
MNFKKVSFFSIFPAFLISIFGCTIQGNKSGTSINSLGMEMVRIEPGEFRMGNEGEIDYSKLAADARHAPYRGKSAAHPYLKDGPTMSGNPLEWDESPSHLVHITHPYYMASKPVTNEQYEQFDPDHAKLRGKRGFSHGDDEAVLFVSWHDAVAFTKWLSKKEGKPYRLPTEAEWEYAARAGTVTAYHMGDTLPEAYHHHQVMNRRHTLEPEKVNLEVGQNPPNAWGLYDMHGLVEEWCYDWYGAYTAETKNDPVGCLDGIARVTRGGSHSTGLPFLRSANRSGALPETRHFLIGFRVVMGEMPGTEPLPNQEKPAWAQNVTQKQHSWPAVENDKPIFREPRTFTVIPKDANGPLFYTHNHNPALTALPNGDLLAIWFTTVKERGREMLVAGARLRQGSDEWDEADVFFHVPDRNQTGQAIWWDGDETVYHFSGVGTGDHWRNLSLVMRTSKNNGVTWSPPEMIGPEFGPRHQPIDAVIQTSDKKIVLLCDAGPEGNGGTVVHISEDGGFSWNDPGRGKPTPTFEAGKQGAWIAGIHAGMVELKDGRWMAFGRGDEINGRMPMSISNDQGKTWTYSSSPFSPIAGAQRLAFIRLEEGPLLLVLFDNNLSQLDSNGNEFIGKGMFAALSFDEGKTWPVKKLITPGEPKKILDAPCNHRWGKEFSTLSKNRAESRGYLTATQSPDGLIHLLSSGTHYAFNLKWLMEPHE